MKRKKMAVRIVALVLVVLMMGGALVSALVSAYAEEAPERNAYVLEIELMEDEQALRISQRLVYTNDSDQTMDRVLFYLYGNMLRRQSALIYEPDALDDVFPDGYVPGGIEFTGITLDGEAADWGIQGTDEMFLRVGCNLQPGQQCEFGFEFHVLLTQNAAFLGVGETDWRLSGFYPVAAMQLDGEFITNVPLSFSRTLFAPLADHRVEITLPQGYELSSPGTRTSVDNGDGTITWHVEASVHELAMSFGKRWRVSEEATATGVTLRLLSNNRSGAKRALQYAQDALELYGQWFGELPFDRLDIAQTDYPLDGLTHDGCIWLPSDLFESGNEEELKSQIRFRIAQQYFGVAAYVDPVADAWLSDSISTYVAYLAQEELDGEAAFLKALNKEIVPSLQLTMPGGLYPTSAASLFSAYEYQVIVLDRGAVVLHEVRSAMGRDGLIKALRLFYEMRLKVDVLGEYDLVEAMDAATGSSWEAFLTDWLFNIGDYADQAIDWFE